MSKNQFGEPFQYIGRDIYRNGLLILNIDDLVDYYINENHSAKETAEHFSITLGNLTVFQNHYGIRKPKNLSHEHNRKTCLAKYGDPNYNNKELIKQTCLERYGVENAYQSKTLMEKAKQTKLARYENANYVNSEKATKTCLEKYGETRAIKTEQTKQKQQETFLAKYGVTAPMKSEIVKAKYNFKEISEKAFETKKKNGTTNTSNIQKQTIKALQGFYGVEDVLVEYKDIRYPYHCDIYIKSLDLFIELNIFFTHGKHPFNPSSSEDQDLLNKWKAKAEYSKFFSNAIRVWTELDPEKQKCAKTNNLNYLMFYTEDEVLKFLKELK